MIEREQAQHHNGANALVLPSRAAGMALGLAALEQEAGPVLITGDSGVGKTWLWRRWAEQASNGWRWVAIDGSASLTPTDLFRTVGHRLGLADLALARDARRALVDYLVEQAADDRKWVLAVDEAHTLSDELLDELRILSSRLGSPGSFTGLVLAAQSTLMARLRSRPGSALENRLAARIHLRPIDADEARALLQSRWPHLAWTIEDVDVLHRDAAGNPQRLLREALLQHVWPAAVQVVVAGDPEARFAAEPPTALTPAEAASVSAAPLLGPAKPPIREEEGLIEVGWDPSAPEAESETDTEPVAPIEPVATPVTPEPALVGTTSSDRPAEEAVEDHYAALQAWNEWAQNQGRKPVAARTAAEPFRTELVDGAEEELKADAAGSGATSHVWADGPTGFAPYSQLFSRLRHSKDQD